MIRKLVSPEIEARLQLADEHIDRTKLLCENPVVGPGCICGAVRGLDVPVSALIALSVYFAEANCYVLCQSLERLENADLLEIDSGSDKSRLTQELNSLFPWIFTGDLVVCWGSSLRWWILFDAQLALGLLVTTDPDDAAEARAAYSGEDELVDLVEAFTECAAHEVLDLPESLRATTGDSLFKSWGIPSCLNNFPPTPDSSPQSPRG